MKNKKRTSSYPLRVKEDRQMYGGFARKHKLSKWKYDGKGVLAKV